MAKKIPQQRDTEFREYLQRSGNNAGIGFLDELEGQGHKLTIKGGGFIGQVTLDCIYGYDVFASDANKEKYISILQTSSAVGNSAVILAYCIINGSAHLLIKADNRATVMGFLKVVNDEFEKSYDGGKSSVGYPFRTEVECKEIKGTHAIWTALGSVHGYSPDSVDLYPYNSFKYLIAGNSIANLILGIELNIVDPNVFAEELLSKIEYRTYKGKFSKEKLNKVLEDLRKRYIYPYARIKEDILSMVIGEACARCLIPYATVAKKIHCYKNRHDLAVTTLSSFILRRGYSFDESLQMLGMATENPNNLIIEVLAEINRLTNYSYTYIMNNVLRVKDDNYLLLIVTFQHLHNAYGWNFVEMCEKFHIVKDAIYIRAQCGF